MIKKLNELQKLASAYNYSMRGANKKYHIIIDLAQKMNVISVETPISQEFYTIDEHDLNKALADLKRDLVILENKYF